MKRAAIIFGLGLFLNGFPYYPLATLRIPGVLQRIAVCYLIAAAIFLYTRLRGQVIWIVSLLAVYWVLMATMPVPGYGAGVLEPRGNFSQYVDSLVLSGHMWSETKFYDPEGIVSTLPAIATVLFGALAGHLLRTSLSAVEKTVWMLLGGNTLMFTGLMMSTWLPINKKLWTSSFAVFMAGMSLLLFAFCFWFVDVQGRRRWAKPFVIFGMNAITVYVASGLIGRVLELIRVGPLGLDQWLYQHVFLLVANPLNASLLFAVANVLAVYVIAWFMYRKGWFVRI